MVSGLRPRVSLTSSSRARASSTSCVLTSSFGRRAQARGVTIRFSRGPGASPRSLVHSMRTGRSVCGERTGSLLIRRQDFSFVLFFMFSVSDLSPGGCGLATAVSPPGLSVPGYSPTRLGRLLGLTRVRLRTWFLLALVLAVCVPGADQSVRTLRQPSRLCRSFRTIFRSS